MKGKVLPDTFLQHTTVRFFLLRIVNSTNVLPPLPHAFACGANAHRANFPSSRFTFGSILY